MQNNLSKIHFRLTELNNEYIIKECIITYEF